MSNDNITLKKKKNSVGKGWLHHECRSPRNGLIQLKKKNPTEPILQFCGERNLK